MHNIMSYNFRIFKTVQMVLSIADIMMTPIRQILVLYYQLIKKETSTKMYTPF